MWEAPQGAESGWANGRAPLHFFTWNLERGTWNARVEDQRSSVPVEAMSRFVDKDILNGRLAHPYGFDPV